MPACSGHSVLASPLPKCFKWHWLASFGTWSNYKSWKGRGSHLKGLWIELLYSFLIHFLIQNAWTSIFFGEPSFLNPTWPMPICLWVDENLGKIGPWSTGDTRRVLWADVFSIHLMNEKGRQDESLCTFWYLKSFQIFNMIVDNRILQ